MKTPAGADPRLELACEILKGWKLGEISEHGGSGSTLSVVELAMNLADALYKNAAQRGWTPNAD